MAIENTKNVLISNQDDI